MTKEEILEMLRIAEDEPRDPHYSAAIIAKLCELALDGLKWRELNENYTPIGGKWGYEDVGVRVEPDKKD